MFVAGWWVAGWWKGELGMKAALTVWLAYVLVDFAVITAAGWTSQIAVLFAVSASTKLAAAYVGGMWAGRGAGQDRAGAGSSG
jgi:hypothetical protein